MIRSSLFRVGFGAESHVGTLSHGVVAVPVRPAAVGALRTAGDILGEALASPIGGPRLRDLARGKPSAAILVPGKDRMAAAAQYLPLILEELNAAGIPDESIEVYLATGTHAKHDANEVARILGPEAFSRVLWHEHDCKNDGDLVSLGTTQRGTEVLFNRRVMEAGVKVLTGRIIPHYFAGFGGGRKALLPGVAARRTIQANHRLTLDVSSGWHPDVQACRLAGNPVHEDMLDAARRVQDTFTLNTLLDTEHRVIGAFAGHLEAAHEAGCVAAARLFRIGVSRPFDAVITCAGGAPYDCNFMQAIKAMFNTREIVRPGGAMLCVAECPAGMHRGFLRWGAIAVDNDLERAVRADYDLTGHNAILLRALVRRVRVALWSALPDEDVRAVGLQPVHSLAEGLDWLQAARQGDFRCGIVPFANVTYATCTLPNAGKYDE